MVRTQALTLVLTGLLVTATAPLPADTLTRIFAIAHSNGDFSKDGGGTAFAVRLPFTDSAASADKLRGHASYRRSGDTASLSIYQEPASSFESRPPLMWLRTRYAVTGSFIGRSALGQAVRVTVRHDQTDALGLISYPETDLIPASKYLPASRQDSYRADISRSIPASDIVAEISGTLVRENGRPPATCSERFYEADVQAPVEANSRICWANVRIQRVAFTRRSTGEVIKQWVVTP